MTVVRRRLVVVLGALGVLAACALPDVAAAADTFVSPTETPVEERAYLDQVVGAYQLDPRYQTIIYPGGTIVNGQVTMDFCGAPFPSDQLRNGRVQVGIRDTETSKGVASVEAVTYRDVAAAAQAMAELRAARAACPKRGFAESRVLGVPRQRWKFAPPPDAQWRAVPDVEREAYDVTWIEPNGDRRRAHLIYLRHGRFLVGIYGPPTQLGSIGIQDSAGEAGLVSALSEQLAELPAT